MYKNNFLIFIGVVVLGLQACLCTQHRDQPSQRKFYKQSYIIWTKDTILINKVQALQYCENLQDMLGVECTGSYSSGFFIKVPQGSDIDMLAILQKVQELSQDENIEWDIELDLVVGHTQDSVQEEGEIETQAQKYQYSDGVFTQVNANYNLARLNNINSNAFAANPYKFVATGQGVNVYVVDKPINRDHVDFSFRGGRPGSRARQGTTVFSGSTNCGQHGTHVAGIVGGLQYGVSKDVTIWEVAVQPCDFGGTTSLVIQGMDWVIQHVKSQVQPWPALIQMSLVALGQAQSLNAKVAQVLANGIPVIIAGGNYNQDACLYSPANVPGVIVTGNVGRSNVKSIYSNYGKCITLWAPGENIVSASFTDNYGSAVLSGTSQAAPHVSGSVAQYLQRNPSATVQQIRSWLLEKTQNLPPENVGEGSPTDFLQLDMTPWSSSGGVFSSAKPPRLYLIPDKLQPIITFKGQTKNPDPITIQILNNGGGSFQWSASLVPVNQSLSDLKVASLSTSDGTLQANQSVDLHVSFNTINLDVGRYVQSLVIKTSDGNQVTRTLPLQVYVYCASLAKPDTDQRLIKVENTSVTFDRPEGFEEDVVDKSPKVYFTTDVSLNYPLLTLDPSTLINPFFENLYAEDDATIYALKGIDTQCSKFQILATKPLGDAWEKGHEICVTIDGAKDVYGQPFEKETICGDQQKYLEGQILAQNMVFYQEQGLVTQDSNVKLIAAFTNPLKQLDKSNFNITIGSQAGTLARKPFIENVTQYNNSKYYYEVELSIPQTYFGKVKIQLQNSEKIKSEDGKSLIDGPALSFKKVRFQILKYSNFQVKEL